MRIYSLLWLPLLMASLAGGQPQSGAENALQKRIAATLKQVSPSVVMIIEGRNDAITGTFITSDGLILTCAHMRAKVGDTVEIGLSNGSRVPARVLSKLVRDDEDMSGKDIALVQISSPGRWPAACVAKEARVAQSDSVLAIGFPVTYLFGMPSVHRPRYVRLGHQISNPYHQHPGFLSTSIYGAGGDSGGPLFDMAGNLIGIASRSEVTGQHLVYTRVEVLRQAWAKLAGNRPAPPVAPATVSHIHLQTPEQAMAAAMASVRSAVVEVRSDDRWIGTGCVVAKGLVLTKASELRAPLSVAFSNNFIARAHVVATDPTNDLALLRLPADELTQDIAVLDWASHVEVDAGMLLAAVTPAEFASRIGVACFAAMPVPPIPGALPYDMKDGPGGVEVTVTQATNQFLREFMRPPTYSLRDGDVITHIEGKLVENRRGYVKLMFNEDHIGDHPIVFGEPIHVTYRRGTQSFTDILPLPPSSSIGVQQFTPSSYRYSGFSSALATDLPARPEDCGAPIVDSQGRLLGILIARSPSLEALVLPAKEVLASLESMEKSAQSSK